MTDTAPDGSERIWFSARDERGRARIATAALSVACGNLAVGVAADHPMLDLGEVGTFDDNGVTGSCLVDFGGRRYLYYTGWTRGISVSFYFYAGCAVSDDGGRTFVRASRAPILERNAIDPFLTASPMVLVENGIFRAWYVSCTGWATVAGTLQHRYHIKYAESDDGIHFRRAGIVAVDFASPDEYAFGRPHVRKENGRYRMWFCARGARYELAYAESHDGIAWERRPAGLQRPAEGWDREMIAYPYVLERDASLYLLYNGNGYGQTGIGYAVSRGSGNPSASAG